MGHFHNACKIKETPFPFPYAQMITFLLVLHMMITPCVVCMWTDRWYWTAVFTWSSVFGMWSINCIATEIENPFGDDVNDLPTRQIQMQVNRDLLVLLDRRSSHPPE